MSTVQDQINAELRYSGLDTWHKNGYTGKGVIVWNTEGSGSHAEIVTRRVKDSAPDCIVLQASLSMRSDANAVLEEYCTYQGVKYPIEEFIKKFNVNVVTRSVGGGTATDRPESKFWNALKDKYNLIFFNSAGNEGTDSIGGSLPPDVAFFCGACNLVNGKPKRASYSSVGEEIDFCNFVGVWSGTSFSAPYTAGEATVLKGRYDLDMSSEEIFKYLIMICEDMNEVGFDNYTGYGIPRFRDINKKYITLTVGNKKYKVDGKEFESDTSPVNKEGNVFVPLRLIAEGLGKTVDWNINSDKTIKVIITDGTNTVVLNTGSTIMTKNGTKVILNFAPYIDENNRTLVPIRAISEAFGCSVDWIQREKKVMILEK